MHDTRELGKVISSSGNHTYARTRALARAPTVGFLGEHLESDDAHARALVHGAYGRQILR